MLQKGVNLTPKGELEKGGWRLYNMSMTSIKLSENGGKAPEAVPYMPAGLNEICCTVNGRAGKRTVMVDAAACERLNADLQEQIKAHQAGGRARPVILFDHKAGAAAAVPTGFEWDEKRGILLRVEWTQAGRTAVEGGNYGYISPAFKLAPQSESITGLQDGVEVGSLVNDPAFTRNECIAAAREVVENVEVWNVSNLTPFCDIEKRENESDNIRAASNGSEKTTEDSDMETVKKQLGLGADATPADIAAAIAALKKKSEAGQKRIEEVEAECNEHKKALHEHKEKAADGFIDRLRKSGKVAHKDEETLKAAREMYMENPERTERIYAAMQPICPAEDGEGDKVQANRVPSGDASKMSVADFYANMDF